MDLVLENLTKRFGHRLAVDIPSLTIRSGDFFTLVGPSGCGKSTTLNLIAGLEEPTTGTLTLGELPLNSLSPHQRNIAFVFQSYALYPHRTVFRNLSFPLEMSGLPREQIRQRVEKAATTLGLAAHLDKRPRELSGGERQRVALGRAMVREPLLFLLDEPLSNLDAPLRAQMRKELKRLHRELGTTFVYVTHDQDEALSVSDRIAVMQDGVIQQCGTPWEIYERPTNRFVASFFGSPPMNFLPAELELDAPFPTIRLEHYRVSLPSKLRAGIKPGPIIVGVRPEHLALSTAEAEDGLLAKVISVEPHGSQVFLELVTVPSGLHLTAVANASPGGQVGSLKVIPDAARLYPFDSETEALLLK
jgi:ABC-type sugar transport system ATPase subunit